MLLHDLGTPDGRREGRQAGKGGRPIRACGTPAPWTLSTWAPSGARPASQPSLFRARRVSRHTAGTDAAARAQDDLQMGFRSTSKLPPLGQQGLYLGRPLGVPTCSSIHMTVQGLLGGPGDGHRPCTPSGPQAPQLPSAL